MLYLLLIFTFKFFKNYIYFWFQVKKSFRVFDLSPIPKWTWWSFALASIHEKVLPTSKRFGSRKCVIFAEIVFRYFWLQPKSIFACKFSILRCCDNQSWPAVHCTVAVHSSYLDKFRLVTCPTRLCSFVADTVDLAHAFTVEFAALIDCAALRMDRCTTATVRSAADRSIATLLWTATFRPLHRHRPIFR